jgi:hypothetical protein
MAAIGGTGALDHDRSFDLCGSWPEAGLLRGNAWDLVAVIAEGPAVCWGNQRDE